jgi:hypothetical protein
MKSDWVWIARPFRSSHFRRSYRTENAEGAFGERPVSLARRVNQEKEPANRARRPTSTFLTKVAVAGWFGIHGNAQKH